MKFYLPDAQDLVDPVYDFVSDEHIAGRSRQRSELYAHEVFREPVADGVLVSKGLVDGHEGSQSRYALSQRVRLLREGARRYFRLERHPRVKVMGDCGAYTYIRAERPPFTVREVIDFYSDIRADYGLAVDHVILEYQQHWGADGPAVPRALRDRQHLTFELASEFHRAVQHDSQPFVPIGVAQGWSPASYARAVTVLQQIGYRYIAIGGLASSKWHAILATLRAVDDVRRSECVLHLLGVRVTPQVAELRRLGVVSFDTTSPLRQAFKDDFTNYYTRKRTYTAIRVQQSMGARIRRLVALGALADDDARRLEAASLAALRGYEQNTVSATDAVAAVLAYEEAQARAAPDAAEQLRRLERYREPYLEVLKRAPWRECACEVCRALGIDVILLRGAERSRRRGFHNLWVFYRELQERLETAPSSVKRSTPMPTTYRFPALELRQSARGPIYVFAADGKVVPDFAAVSRVRRDGLALEGYQRNEVRSHVQEIKRYIEGDAPLIPNSIVVAFDSRVKFEATASPNPFVRVGDLVVPVGGRDRANDKPGFVVDGQQRLAAIREAQIPRFDVLVSAFVTDDVRYQAEQFILVNSTKPLPKGLIFELLPHTGGRVPSYLEKRRLPSQLAEALNQQPESPFRGLIQTPTCADGVVKDFSVIKMLENSLRDGILYRFRSVAGEGGDTDAMLNVLCEYWRAVSEVFSESWGQPPKKSRLMHGAGVVAMGYVMDAIAERHRSVRCPPKDVFIRDLVPLRDVCRWTNGYWPFGPTDQRKWNDINNTTRDTRELTRYLVSQYKRLVWSSVQN